MLCRVAPAAGRSVGAGGPRGSWGPCGTARSACFTDLLLTNVITFYYACEYTILDCASGERTTNTSSATAFLHGRKRVNAAITTRYISRGNKLWSPRRAARRSRATAAKRACRRPACHLLSLSHRRQSFQPRRCHRLELAVQVRSVSIRAGIPRRGVTLDSHVRWSLHIASYRAGMQTIRVVIQANIGGVSSRGHTAHDRPRTTQYPCFLHRP